MFGFGKKEDKKKMDVDTELDKFLTMMESIVKLQSNVLSLTSTANVLYNRIYTLEALIAQLTLKISDIELRGITEENKMN